MMVAVNGGALGQAVELVCQLDEAAGRSPDWQLLDARFDELIGVYGALPEAERKSVRGAYNACVVWGRHELWLAHPSYVARFRSHGREADLRRALAHISMSDGFPDARDAVMAFEGLRRAAAEHGIDPEACFREIAEMTSPDDTGIGSLASYMG